MRKYVFMFLMCCPLIAFGAPSVRALGSGAVSGSAAAKVTPTKASVVSTDRSSGMARVGSLRAKATTAVAPSTTTSSTSRFPVILPTKVYNTANAPRPTGYSSSSTIINTDVDLSGIEAKIETNRVNIETNAGKIDTNTQNIATNTEQITTNTGNITTNTTNITNLSREANSIRIGGATKPTDFDDDNKESNRAWIWVEQQ